MKVSQLFESDPLQELEQVMTLRSTGSRISQAQAEAALRWLRSEKLEWELLEQEGQRFFRIRPSSFKATAGTGATLLERKRIRMVLFGYGFQVVSRIEDAIAQHGAEFIGQHIYFW